jgi:hypothetical protein
MGWRELLPVHPAAELFPLMSKDELRELADDIEKNGQVEPISLYSENGESSVLDGRNRLDALELLGRIIIRSGVITSNCKWRREEGDPYAYVLSKNIHRRHLTPEQKRELIVKVLKAKPEASNATVAKQVKVDDKTVAKVRRKLESTSEIPRLEKTVGADGKTRKARIGKKQKEINEMYDERDRKTCVALHLKATGANRELLLMLADRAGDYADKFFSAHQSNPQALTERVIEKVRRAIEAWTKIGDKLGLR